MTINDHAREFMGKRIVAWEPPEVAAPGRKRKAPAKRAAGAVYRIAVEEEESWVEKFEQFLETPLAAKAAGLVLGLWGPGYDEPRKGASPAARAVKSIAAARAQLPALRGVFFGDITYEEQEISWIVQTDLSPLLRAFPKLEHLRVRGGSHLSLGTLRHERLKSLVVETGGLPASVVRQVGASRLPALEHLELWFGSDSYGGDAKPKDLEKILSGKLFPKLRHLGLRDCEWADDLTRAVARSPLLARLHVLDLSLGTLSDNGAAALLASDAAEALRKLKKIDLHHHYITPWMAGLLKAEKFKLDLSDAKTPSVEDGELHRYIAVAE